TRVVICDYLAPPDGKTGVSRTSRIDQMWSVRHRAMAGVRGSNFFCPGFGPEASEASGADGTSYRRSSPSNRGRLWYHHAAQRPGSGEPDGRSGAAPSRCVVQWPTYWASCSPDGQRLLNATLRTMGIADVHRYDVLPFPMLDNLHMRQRAGDTVAQFRKAPPTTLAAGAIGLAEDCREQTGIAGFAIRKQDQVMTIGKALGGLRQQAPDQRLIPPPLDVRYDKLALRVDNLRFPLRLTLVVRVAVSFVRLQRHDFQFLDPFLM